jgi:hypothetical protein
MDVLKVFNLVVCANTNTKTNSFIGSSSAFFNLLFAPLYILIPTSRFAILAYLSIFIFTIIIYSSQSSFIKLLIADRNTGIPKISNSLFIAFLLYILQTAIILLFLRYSICDTTLEWEGNNLHFTLQQYDTEDYSLQSGK